MRRWDEVEAIRHPVSFYPALQPCGCGGHGDAEGRPGLSARSPPLKFRSVQGMCRLGVPDNGFFPCQLRVLEERQAHRRQMDMLEMKAGKSPEAWRGQKRGSA